jgi:hypothetical protein
MGRLFKSCLGASLLSVAILNSCRDSNHYPNYPDDVFCDKDMVTKGGRTEPGFSSITLFDLEDKDWLSSPPGDFSYYNNHDGGTGNTLEMTGCDDGVYVKFTYSSLKRISVRSPWDRETDTGISIGSDLSELLTAHPNARRMEHVTQKGEYYWVKGNFIAGVIDDKVWGMQVSTLNYDTSGFQNAFGIGPSPPYGSEVRWSPPSSQNAEIKNLETYLFLIKDDGSLEKLKVDPLFR